VGNTEWENRNCLNTKTIKRFAKQLTAKAAGEAGKRKALLSLRLFAVENLLNLAVR
jgi:hypothetical protein